MLWYAIGFIFALQIFTVFKIFKVLSDIEASKIMIESDYNKFKEYVLKKLQEKPPVKRAKEK